MRGPSCCVQESGGLRPPKADGAPGGAWTIGYKAWGSLLARRLSKQGVLVACLDYRNFPQVSAAILVRMQC